MSTSAARRILHIETENLSAVNPKQIGFESNSTLSYFYPNTSAGFWGGKDSITSAVTRFAGIDEVVRFKRIYCDDNTIVISVKPDSDGEDGKTSATNRAENSINIGHHAGNDATYPAINVGPYAGYQSSNGADSNGGIHEGYQAGYYSSGSKNISLGNKANYELIGAKNIGVGDTSNYQLSGTNNFGFGYNTNYIASADDTISIGDIANYRGVGKRNINLGFYSGYMASADDCVNIGKKSGYQNTIDDRLEIRNENNSLIRGDFLNTQLEIGTTSATIMISDTTDYVKINTSGSSAKPLSLGVSGTDCVYVDVTGGYPDIYTVPWTEHSDSCNLSGFASTTAKHIYYKYLGRTLFCEFYIVGTSDSNKFTFTLPSNPRFSVDAVGGSGPMCGIVPAKDDGSDTPATLSYEGANGTIIISKGNGFSVLGDDNWTTSGDKGAAGSFFYEVV
jgi:hypothetical protein